MLTIFNILTSAPSDLIYHLVVGFAMMLIIIIAAVKVKHTYLGSRARHVLVGCGILFILQMILFSLSISLDPQHTTIPVIYGLIERSVHALAVVWLTWTFVESGKQILLTSLAGFISLFITLSCGLSVGFSISRILFLQLSDTLLLILWQIGTIILILSGLILMLITRPKQWGLAISMLALLAVGYLLQLSMGSPTPLMGTVRLTQMISFPWLIALVSRFNENKLKAETPEVPPEPSKEYLPKQVKPELIDDLLKINLVETDQEKYKAAARALSLSVVSDICYLIVCPEEREEVHILAGYDLIREEPLQGASLKREDFPKIITAWEHHQRLELHQAGTDIQDAATFTSLLRYHRIGNLLAYPLRLPHQPIMGGVVFLSPYTNKEWGEETHQQMSAIEETLAQVLFAQDLKAEQHTQIDELQTRINTLKAKREALESELSQKDIQIKALNNSIKQLKARYQKEKLQAVKQIDCMKDHLQELNKQTTSQDEQLKNLEQTTEKIRRLIYERDQLKSALEDANSRIKKLETQADQTGPIRLSMESQIISLDSIAANIKLQINAQLRQKNITLEIINPNGRQMVKTDPELLQTVLQGLLNNAILASEQNAKIQLSQKISYETGMLILQVTDYAEGLTPGEQKDLFSANRDSIPGIGSVQSIKNAIRAIRILNGKIWLRSKKGAFTSFRVQLPIRIID